MLYICGSGSHAQSEGDKFKLSKNCSFPMAMPLEGLPGPSYIEYNDLSSSFVALDALDLNDTFSPLDIALEPGGKCKTTKRKWNH